MNRKNQTTLIIDLTWNTDDESLAASWAGQPRGDGDYLKKLDLVGAVPQAYAMRGIPST
jgi:hypothetical protein